MNQKQKDNLRKFYSGKKYKPLDLRPKKTRAIRKVVGPMSIKSRGFSHSIASSIHNLDLSDIRVYKQPPAMHVFMRVSQI